jgi:hypothetical protein
MRSNRRRDDIDDEDDAQLIEQTSKKWKKLQLIGGAVFFVGLILLGLCFKSAISTGQPNVGAVKFGQAIGSLAVMAGLGIAGYGAAMAWWKHG